MDFPYQTALFAVGTGKQTRKLPIIHIENRVSKTFYNLINFKIFINCRCLLNWKNNNS